MRLVCAFILAPLVTPLTVISFNCSKIEINRGTREVIGQIVSLIVGYGVPAELVTVIFGIPLYFVYLQKHVTSWIAYAMAGAVISQIPMIVFAFTGTLLFLTGEAAKGKAWLQALPLSLLCGVLSSLTFWWLIGRKAAS
jgi:hypothetical protein